MKCTFQDAGARIWDTVRRCGRMGSLAAQTLAMIRFFKNTTDEFYISYLAMTRVVRIENPRTSPRVSSRYFGLETDSDYPTA
ncbi:hypothetical protein N9B88_00845 [Rubripirellula sp.]|nr:hypothetical protein [Rubripirellula sp.]